MYCIGDLITEYEQNIKNANVEKKEQKLYRTKDVVKKYPFLTIYSLFIPIKKTFKKNFPLRDIRRNLSILLKKSCNPLSNPNTKPMEPTI